MFQYCPTCGTKLTLKPAGDDGEIPYCEQCEKFWFPTFPDCVIVLVANAQYQIVLAKMPYLSEQYKSLISGYMKPGENAEAAALREVKEELGLSGTSIDYAGTYWLPKHQMMMHGFIVQVADDQLVLSAELESAEWVSVAEAPARMWPASPENAALQVCQLYAKNY